MANDANDFVISGGKLVEYRGGESDVFLPIAVMEIAPNVFEGKPIRTVSLPPSVRVIGNNAFAGCETLERVVITQGVRELSSGAFLGCTALREVVLPKSVVTIGAHAFKGCTSLASITLPEGLTSICNGAFQSSGLLAIDIPASVKEIGPFAFIHCERLAEVRLHGGLERICQNAFGSCRALTSIELPEGLQVLEQMAFAFCTSLANVTIPASVTMVDRWAFRGCSGMEWVRFEGDPVIRERAFETCRKLERADGPEEDWFKQLIQQPQRMNAFWETPLYREGGWILEDMKRSERIASNVCTYCGGSFGGLITKRCKECGRPKDY